MKAKILPNILLSFAVLFMLTRLLTAGTNDGTLNFGKIPLGPLQIARGFNPLPNGGYVNQTTANGTKKDMDAAAVKAAQAREARIHGPVDFPGPNAGGTYITFDAPGAVNGTYPSSINPTGAIVGTFYDVNYVGHGFVRAASGTITTFDVPDAVNGPGTFPSSINPAGVIIGDFGDVNFVEHGFLRSQDGTITTFDVPVPPGGFFFFSGINAAGTSIGTLYDANFVPHGFIRTKGGTITTIDVPDGVNGTKAVAINAEGVIAGVYTDASSVTHGFLRAGDGTFTTFDSPAPGHMEPFAPFSFGPLLSITPQGVITGSYFETIPGNPFGGNFRVFVRATDGTFTTFDAATYPPCCIWSFPSGINQAGTITGSFNDGYTINHGFVRTSDGTITTFDVPGAGTGFNQGTAPLGITPGGVIMGLYLDTNYGIHGFVRIP